MTDPVADSELLLRRIPAVFVETGRINPEAFRPHRTADQDGLSLTRALLEPPTALLARARNPSAVVYGASAREVRTLKLSVIPSPTPEEPGHCHIPELNSSLRSTPATRLAAAQLAHLFSQTRVAPDVT